MFRVDQVRRRVSAILRLFHCEEHIVIKFRMKLRNNVLVALPRTSAKFIVKLQA